MIIRWIRSNWSVLFNSGSLIATRLIAAVSGFAYWAIAANRFPTQTIGFSGAALSAMNMVGTFSMLGIGTFLVSQLHRKDAPRASMVTSGLIVGTATGLLVGAAFALLGPSAVHVLDPLRSGAGNVALFALGCAVTTFMLLLEEVLVGLLLGGFTILRSVMFALIRLGALWLLLSTTTASNDLTMLAAWMIGDALSGVVLLGVALAQGRMLRLGRFDPAIIRAAASTALRHHFLTFALNISGLFVPLVVAAVLSAQLNAMFAVAWLNTSLAFAIPFSLSSVLYAAGNAEPGAARAKLRQVLLMGAGASALAGAAFWFAAPFVMRRFGEAYTEPATWAIRLIVLAVFPVLVKSLWVTMQRIHNRMGFALRVVTAGAILELGMPAIGGLTNGLYGACAGWLASQIILGVLYAWPLWRLARD